MRTSFNKSRFVITGLCMGALFCALWHGVAAAQGPIEVLVESLISETDDPGIQAISGHIVVFDRDNDIYGYDLTSKTEFPVTIQPAVQQVPDISEATAVWMDLRNGNWDIYGRELGSGDVFPISTNLADQRSPAIDDNTVVWVDWRNGGNGPFGNDLYGFDLTSGAEFRITNQSAPVACPAISGNVVVWSDFRSGDWDVYSKNLITDDETRITFSSAPDPFCPAISNGIIVSGWENSVSGFDLSGNVLFTTQTLLYPFYGRPAMDGDLVVWQERQVVVCLSNPCSSTVVGYDVRSGFRFAIPQGLHEGWSPDISGDTVVWRDYDSSFLVPPSPPLTGVYVSNLLRTVQFHASATTVSPGDYITYTITLVDATITGALRSLTNTLPSSFNLDQGSLEASSGNYGYDPATRTVSWSGTVSSANPITITYRVRVSPDVSFGDYIVNPFIINDQTGVFTYTTTTWVAHSTFLPVIMQDTGS